MRKPGTVTGWRVLFRGRSITPSNHRCIQLFLSPRVFSDASSRSTRFDNVLITISLVAAKRFFGALTFETSHRLSRRFHVRSANFFANTSVFLSGQFSQLSSVRICSDASRSFYKIRDSFRRNRCRFLFNSHVSTFVEKPRCLSSDRRNPVIRR